MLDKPKEPVPDFSVTIVEKHVRPSLVVSYGPGSEDRTQVDIEDAWFPTDEGEFELGPYYRASARRIRR